MSETGYSSEGEWKLSNFLSSVLIWYLLFTRATCSYFVCRNGVEIIGERILPTAFLETVHYLNGESRKRSHLGIFFYMLRNVYQFFS